jgi:hypothetical protein
VAGATARGVRRFADAIGVGGGYEAVQLWVAESFIERFGELAKSSNTRILSSHAAAVASMIASALSVIR